MSDEKKMKYAQVVFNSLCEMMDDNNLKYARKDKDLSIEFVMGGDDIPMPFLVEVDAEREIIRLLSPIPMTFEENKRVEGAIVTSKANYNIVDGSFDYDYSKGRVTFRLTSSYKGSLISKDLFHYMVAVSTITVDKYNDKFLAVSKGLMTVEEFFKL